MSFLDVEVYDKIGVPAKRTAIIITNITKEDPHYNQIAKDVILIKQMLANLGFVNDRIKVRENLERNVIESVTTNHCTLNDSSSLPPNEGYIMMFNLAYKTKENLYRAVETWYDSVFIHNIFTINKLKEWASKPKLIFNQTPLMPKSIIESSTNMITDDATSKIKIPAEVDIFESFSGTSTEDSYGDENGSFYIQALCENINQHIANNKPIQNKTLNLIMYEVYANIKQRMESANQIMENGDKMGPQTPFHQSTHVKKFLFPI